MDPLCIWKIFNFKLQNLRLYSAKWKVGKIFKCIVYCYHWIRHSSHEDFCEPKLCHVTPTSICSQFRHASTLELEATRLFDQEKIWIQTTKPLVSSLSPSLHNNSPGLLLDFFTLKISKSKLIIQQKQK